MYNSNRIYMDKHTITHGKECFDCLRWFVPVFNSSDPCPHCKRLGKPPHPNRLRYLAIKADISLREISRITGLSWRTVRTTSQGESSPNVATKKKLSKALGMSIRKEDIAYIFPYGKKNK